MTKLSKEVENKIIENNHSISKLLERNEELYLSELSDMDRRLFTIKDEDKILIPNGYIRKKEDFITSYGLANITSSYKHQSNIAYLMQYADLMHFIHSRFYIYGQISKVHYYYDIINLSAILEVILKELAQQYRDKCTKCKNKINCPNIISKETYSDLKKLISKLNELKIINLNNRSIEKLKNLIDLRNKIHLRLMADTLYNTTELSRDFYNDYMMQFKSLVKSISLSNIVCSIQQN